MLRESGVVRSRLDRASVSIVILREAKNSQYHVLSETVQCHGCSLSQILHADIVENCERRL